MFIHMRRTTLVLEEACMEGIREIARREGRPMSAIVNELLSEGLVRRSELPAKVFRLPAFDMGRPCVNLADRDALESVMEA
jgi:hypothetical protein